jgi:glucosylceramidase
MMSVRNFSHKTIVTIVFFSLLLSNCSGAQQTQHNGDDHTGIEVYVSSRDGDRLTRKKNAMFSNETKSSLPVITVDESKIYQTVEGFGATFNEAGMICLNSLSPADKEKVLRSLFDSLRGSGFSLMKSPIAACDFASAGPWYSYNENPRDTLMTHFSIERDLGPNGLVTYIKAASRYGRFRIESPMDFAPDWMYYGLNKGQKHIEPKYYNALARYYSKYIQAYLTNGVQINYLNLFNEADNEWYSNVTYPVIADLIKNHVVPQLVSDGLSVKIQFGETSNRPEATKKFPAILDDVELRRHINSLTVHGYDWNKFSTLTELHNKFPDLPIWQTEVCYALPNNVPHNGPTRLPLYDFSDGEFWGNMIINDMKNWASAWIYWNMILDQEGGPWLVSVEHGDPDNNKQHPVVIIDRNTRKVSYTGLYYYLTHFSKFVRPGAVRIETSGGSEKLDFVGFQNMDHSIVLNVINNGEASGCKIKWHSKTFVQKLPAHSITTLKWAASLTNR